MIDKQEAQIVITQVNAILKSVFGADCCYLMLINVEGSNEVNAVCTMNPEAATYIMHHMADRIDAGEGEIFTDQKPS